MNYENTKTRQKQTEEPGPAGELRADTVQPNTFESIRRIVMLHKTISEVTETILEVARENRLRRAFGGYPRTYPLRAKAFTPIAGASFTGDKEECSPCSYGKIFTLGDIYRYYVRKNSPSGTESTTSSDETSDCREAEPHQDNDITGPSY